MHNVNIGIICYYKNNNDVIYVIERVYIISKLQRVYRYTRKTNVLLFKAGRDIIIRIIIYDWLKSPIGFDRATHCTVCVNTFLFGKFTMIGIGKFRSRCSRVHYKYSILVLFIGRYYLRAHLRPVTSCCMGFRFLFLLLTGVSPVASSSTYY